MVLSEPILDELERTLAKPYFSERLDGELIAVYLALVRRTAIVVPISTHVSGVASHPEDDLILATAVSAGATHLVTGDGDLRRLGIYRGIAIVGPNTFVDMLVAGER